MNYIYANQTQSTDVRGHLFIVCTLWQRELKGEMCHTASVPMNTAVTPFDLMMYSTLLLEPMCLCGCVWHLLKTVNNHKVWNKLDLHKGALCLWSLPNNFNIFAHTHLVSILGGWWATEAECWANYPPMVRFLWWHNATHETHGGVVRFMTY